MGLGWKITGCQYLSCICTPECLQIVSSLSLLTKDSSSQLSLLIQRALPFDRRSWVEGDTGLVVERGCCCDTQGTGERTIVASPPPLQVFKVTWLSHNWHTFPASPSILLACVIHKQPAGLGSTIGCRHVVHSWQRITESLSIGNYGQEYISIMQHSSISAWHFF